MLTSDTLRCFEPYRINREIGSQQAKMKTIVVSGARSNVGKTTLARNLTALFDDSVFVKIGHHQDIKPEGDRFFRKGTPVSELLEKYGNHRYLIIESNSILIEHTPDCTIFLPADTPKPSAFLAEKKADIVRGKIIDEQEVIRLASRLDIETDLMRRIVLLAGASLSSLSVSDGKKCAD